MDRDTFARRFREAAESARDFARTFIAEELPEAMRFCLQLNSSYDGNPLHADEKVYPEDSSYERARAVHACSEDDAIAALWRDGTVPEWIDLSVVGIRPTVTWVQLTCCGRFTANESLLYHEQGGRPPFQVVGPYFPPDYKDGQRFSIHRIADAWNWDDIEFLRKYTQNIGSLSLTGAAFDDRVFCELPALPRMENLELRASPVSGGGLRNLDKHRALWGLTIRLAEPHAFHLEAFPQLPHFESLSLYNLSASLRGLDVVARQCPRFGSLTLKAAGELVVDALLPRRMTRLFISATRLEGAVHLPSDLESLCLHLPRATKEEVGRLLEAVNDTESLELRDTPIDDAFLEAFVSRASSLKRLRPFGVSGDAIQRIRRARPELDVFPRA